VVLQALALVITCAPPQVSAGDDVACVLLDGAVYCWGENNDGELGDGTTITPRPRAGPVPALKDVVHLSVGDDLLCAVRRNGAVACWGEAFARDEPVRRVPKAVKGVSDAVAVQVLNRGACVIRRDQSIACWGQSRPPRTLGKLGKASQIAMRDGLGCARRKSGMVECWSYASRQPSSILAPPRPWLTGAQDIAVATSGLCGVVGGRVQCVLEASEAPPALRVTDAVAVTRNNERVCLIHKTGTVGCSRRGAKLTAIPTITGAVDLSVGAGFVCAVDATGAVWCWGEGDYGQLGHGKLQASTTPVKVLGLPANAAPR